VGGDCSNPIYFATHAGECVSTGVGGIVSAAANNTLQELTNQALQGFGQAVGSLGTMWVYLPSPVLTNGTGQAGGGTPPGSSGVTTILGYVTWIALVICVLSIIAIGAMLAVRIRRGDGEQLLGRLGIVFAAVILISGATALITGLLPNQAPGGSASAVGFLQNSLWWYVGAMAVVSVIIAGIRMAWEQRANPGKELLQSLLTLIVVSGAGLTIIGLAVTATDAFSVWVLNGATQCDVSVAGQSNCFGTNVAAMIGLSSTSPLALLAILILALLAMLMSWVQIALMIVRGGLLVVLAGVLPITASFTNTQMGRQWFSKAIGWTIAFILYKPAAALIYAAAFRLTGSDAFGANGIGIVSILTGIGLMILALFALPALLRFVAPMTSAAIGGGSGGLAMGAMGAAMGVEAATGAIPRTSSSSVGAPASSMAPSGAAAAGGSAAGAGGAAAGSGAAAGGAAAGGAAAASAATGVGIPVAAGIAVAQGAAKVGGQIKTGLESAAADSAGEPSGA
jgi:type IV secretion system protein TrbL